MNAAWLRMLLAGCLSAGVATALGIPTVRSAATAHTTADRHDVAIGALARSLDWLARHKPDPDGAPIGNLALDAWTWHLFATAHPDPNVNRRAAEQLDRRLRALPQPTEPTVVSVSYWAILIRLMQLRGMAITAHRDQLAGTTLAALIREADPTTGWWIGELFRRAGFAVEPSFRDTFIATGTAATTQYAPTTRDAYRLFHELVPATDLGRKSPARLQPEEHAFVRRVLPGLIAVSQARGDTDAVAEALVSAAVMDERDTGAYRDGLAWLVARQQPDGTYFSTRDLTAARTPDHYRHVVLVASWAVLTSLPGANRAVGDQ